MSVASGFDSKEKAEKESVTEKRAMAHSLRQRASPSSKRSRARNFSSNDAKVAEISSDRNKRDVHNTKKQIHNQRSRSFATVALAVACALGLSLVFWWNHNEVLPRAYALCSREGGIYTVDDEHPQVECIVVYDKLILATGSIGERRLYPLAKGSADLFLSRRNQETFRRYRFDWTCIVFPSVEACEERFEVLLYEAWSRSRTGTFWCVSPVLTI